MIDDLSQRDANEILVVLRDHQIEAKKVGQTTKKSVIYRIEVKEQCAKDALRLLVHNQIPKIQRAGLKEVYPPGGSGIIPSKSDELARMTMAMQGEIEALLKVIPGIADARVVMFPTTRRSTISKNPRPKKLLPSLLSIIPSGRDWRSAYE